ncbi:MAG: thiamine pyrophosphate-binding protein, partial [Peptococcaceae bacterium]|nr:thiamine pyrophosphate-binding protein [Peptococcaceae bacterium]
DAMIGFMGQAFTSPQVPIHPLRLCYELRQRIDKDTIIVIDGGDTASWGNMLLPAMGPGQMLTIATGSFGPLGVGVPYAMAAKLAHPDKKVILLTGDGAFGYGAMEYDTMMRYGLNITTVILNDACWGMIKNSEAKRSGQDKDFVGLYLRETHYEKIAEAVGGYGEYVTEPDEIGPAIDRALAQDKPSIVNVMTDVKIGFAF